MGQRKGNKTGARTLEAIIMSKLKKSSVFYSTKKDKDLTAIAAYCNRKIKTERLILVSGRNQQKPTAGSITKVTLAN